MEGGMAGECRCSLNTRSMSGTGEKPGAEEEGD